MKTLIIANWKCNPKTKKEAENLYNSIEEIILKNKDKEVVICPPFVYLNIFKEIKIGAQNCFHKEEGAYTGEISVKMLKDLNCKYIILGHSERREYFNEESGIINQKIKLALQNNITPIFCIGESSVERKNNKTKEVLRRQIKEGLKGVDDKKVIIAYEPIWAISRKGKNNPCSPNLSKEVLLFIKSISKSIVIYGGSVNSNNAKDYISIGFDGLLIGNASLDKEDFNKVVEM